MKKTIQKYVSLFIVLTMCCVTIANGLEGGKMAQKSENAVAYAIEQIKQSYVEYYEIPFIDGEVVEMVSDTEGQWLTIRVDFTKILLASSAYELPYIQGLMDEFASETDESKKALVKEYIDVRVKDLEGNYIGVEQEERTMVKVFVPNQTLFSTKQVEHQMALVTEEGEIGFDYFAPATEEEMYQDGKTDAQAIVVDQDAQQINTKTVRANSSSASDYDRVKARDYVRKYSCGKCPMNSHSCKNTAYTFYASADCANFVSQAIHDGGIQQETNWKPGKITWINTGYSDDYYGLTEYMVDQGFFFSSTDKYKAIAGSIILWPSSHGGMVDQNDTVTLTYCAHTSDAKSSSFKNFGTGYKYFIPVYDSYAEAYTPQ